MPNKPERAGEQDPAVRHTVFRHRPVNFGPLPLIAIDRRMRPVEYSPAFRLDSAAVRTTRFITLPAPLRPDFGEERHKRADVVFIGGVGNSRASKSSDPM